MASKPADVTLAQRSKAKMVSYGLAYGMESYGLSQRLGVPVEEASEILKAYFVAFPAVHEYMDRIVREARDKGYTETLFGRRRLLPELSSTNFRTRQAAERQAMNAPIQGLAADIFKVALVKLHADLLDAGVQARLVLQVHDEVILEVPPDEGDAGGAPHGRGHAGRRRPVGPARGQRLAGATPGPTPRASQAVAQKADAGQALSGQTSDWTRAALVRGRCGHLGSAYLRYSFTKGTDQEVGVPG